MIEFEAVRFQEVKLSDARSASGRGRAITLRGFRGGGEGLLFFREHFYALAIVGRRRVSIMSSPDQQPHASLVGVLRHLRFTLGGSRSGGPLPRLPLPDQLGLTCSPLNVQRNVALMFCFRPIP